MKLQSHLPRQSPWLYIAPLLNTILLLLVYFLFSSSFVVQSGVTVTLPESASRLTGFDRAHIITVAAGSEGLIYYDGARVSMTELRASLERDRNGERRAIVHADVRAPLGLAGQVCNEALAMGFDVALATTPRSAPQP